MRFRHIAALVAVALLVALPAAAQETTGAITGAVEDPDGALLARRHRRRPTGPIGTVQTVSDERGEFRFPRLPSGRYKLTATLTGFAPARGDRRPDGRPAPAGSSSRSASAGVTETVEVVGESTASMDLTTCARRPPTSPASASTCMPRGRDFTDVVTQAAGAANESQAGGISIDGSSGSENRFVIDGIDTTSPQVGTNAVPMRADFLEEVQVKSAGYAAEYGGSTGGVINAITRAARTRSTAASSTQCEERSWGGDERPILRDSLTTDTYTYIDPEKDDESRIDPGLLPRRPDPQGPAVVLRLLPARHPQHRADGHLPRTASTNTFPQDFTVNYGTANITGNIGSKLLFRAGVNYSPYTTEGTCPARTARTTLTSPDQYLRGTDGKREHDTPARSTGRRPTTSWSRRASAASAPTRESTGSRSRSLIHNFSTASTPAGLAALRPVPAAVGLHLRHPVTDAQAKDEYKRDYIGADATYFFTAGGEHQLKFGYQTEEISNDVQRGYNADRILYYAGRTYTNSTGVSVRAPTATSACSTSRPSARPRAATRRSSSRTPGGEAPADPEPRPAQRAGEDPELRRREAVETPIEFELGREAGAPARLHVRPGGRRASGRSTARYGKYYDVMKYEMPRGSFGGDKWVDYFYTWDNPDYRVNGAGCATGTNTISERPNCAGGTLIEPLDRRFNSAMDLEGRWTPTSSR